MPCCTALTPARQSSRRCTIRQNDNSQWAKILCRQKCSGWKSRPAAATLIPPKLVPTSYCSRVSPEKPQPSKLAIMALIKLLMKVGVLK